MTPPHTTPTRPAPLRRPGRALLAIPLLVLGLTACAQSRPSPGPETGAPGALHLPTQIVPPAPRPEAAQAAADHAAAEPPVTLVAQAAPKNEVNTHPVAPPPAAAVAPAPPLPPRMEGGREAIAAQVREGLKGDNPSSKRINIIVDSKSSNAGVMAGPGKPANPALNSQRAASSNAAAQPKPAAQAKGPAPSQSPNAIKPAVARNEPGIVVRARPVPSLQKPRVIPWSYSGEGGPDNWHKLKPEYALCGKGQRQSPIAVDGESSLRGPAEAIEFNYTPSRGTVTDTGHTVEVKVTGDHNSLSVRNTTYHLQDFHFHHPGEELVNGQNFPMSAHFVHRNDRGQLAILTVLFETGEPNLLINKVWTHMPLGIGDSVLMPPGLIDLNEILPSDRRYFQYMGSLTTPPCTEGVLWLILKRPVSISPEQLALFAQLYPNNARPLQAHNNRAVRDATSIAPGAGRLAGYTVIEPVPSPTTVEVQLAPAPAATTTPAEAPAAP